MHHWMALLPASPREMEGAKHTHPGTSATQDARYLGWWALQYTPRVALLEDVVVLEYRASERLFGGTHALQARLVHEAQQQGAQAWSFAPNALAALCLARHQAQAQALPDAQDEPELAARLAPLPFISLSALRPHAATLERLGCRTLGQVRALPRAGFSRRFGAEPLHALDQAHGIRPEAFSWLTIPDVFDERLELPGRVESAPELAHAARVLLQRLSTWLGAQQAGVEALTLRWHHGLRRLTARTGQHTLQLAAPTRDADRLECLLHEHLQRLKLEAPVEDISLRADRIGPLALHSHSLFPEHGGGQLSAHPDALITPAAQRAQKDALWTLLDQLSNRLGGTQVQMGCLHADHRLERAQRWQAALLALQQSPRHEHHAISPWPQPSWLLPEPLPLSMVSEATGLPAHPFYQGRLQWLAGPHRIEAGWWDSGHASDPCARDYYLASSPGAGLMWVFRARHANDHGPDQWFLHGLFA